MKKYISIFLMTLSVVLLMGCKENFKDNTKNILTLGINIEFPKDMKIGFSESKMFKYNATTVPSITIQGINKKSSITLKSFPFSIEDYKKHFKSAFEGDYLKEIVYDYKEIKGTKEIDSVYKSKAILDVGGTKKYSYVYLVSFKNNSGTLIIETTSEKNDDFEKVLKSIKPIKSNVTNIPYKNYNESKDLKDVKIVEDVNLKIPSSFEIKRTHSKNAYYINGFGKNAAIYVVASKQVPSLNNNLYWNNINGYEILKKFDDKNFLIHDINTQKLFFLNTEIKEVKSSTNQKYYLRIEKIWR